MRLPFLTRNVTLKVFSLVAAVLIFIFVSVENATPVDVEFRIDYTIADDMMLTGDPPNLLHATLQGPWANLRSFERNELQPVVIDLSGAEPGTLRHRIETADLRPPGGMGVVSFRPAELELTLDRRVERQVPVEPDLSERPAFGYEILAVRIEPPRVRVVGPFGKMRTLDFVSTRPIAVNGRSDDVVQEIELRPPPPGLRLLDKRVRVQVEIGEEHVQRTFHNVPVGLEGAPAGTRLTPEQVTITLKGPRRHVDSMDRASLELFVSAQPEAAEGRAAFEKAVELRNAPERTLLVTSIPKVLVQLPKAPRRRR